VSALHLVVVIAAAASALAWLLSLLTRDTSWVDRLWSLLPETYVVVFAASAEWHDARLDLMAALGVLWGARLTFNFARKGGYSGVEDYRWAVLRARMSGWQFQLFNLGFIVLYQNALLVLIALPALTAADHPTPLGALDLVLAALFLVCLMGETVADQQQWEFHRRKHAALQAGRPLAKGFLDEGLFARSRHPNYFFELAQWWLLFGLGASAARSPWQWTVLGPILLTILFVGSTRFTEEISAARYPDYAGYQGRVAAVVPWTRRRSGPGPR
jgi:steroid 5-alpha reductase family enzyme